MYKKMSFDFGQSSYLKVMFLWLCITDVCSPNARYGHAATWSWLSSQQRSYAIWLEVVF